MPGFYSSTQVRYFKEQERKEHEAADRKQAWKEGIRARAFEKTNKEIGQARKVKVNGVPEGFVAGNPGFNVNEPCVADLFKEPEVK